MATWRVTLRHQGQPDTTNLETTMRGLGGAAGATEYWRGWGMGVQGGGVNPLLALTYFSVCETLNIIYYCICARFGEIYFPCAKLLMLLCACFFSCETCA